MKALAAFFTIFVTVLLPIAVAIYLCRQKKTLIKPLLIGAMTFLVFQIILRIPLIQIILPKFQWYLGMPSTHPLLFALFLGVTAALFEEGGRFVIMKLLLKNNREVVDGIAFGLGHGGIEAILLIGISVLLQSIVNYEMINPSTMFLGGLERLATMIIHICWSLMILKFINEKKLIWIAIPLATHTLIDAGSAYALTLGISTWAIDGVIILCAILSLMFIKREYKLKN